MPSSGERLARPRAGSTASPIAREPYWKRGNAGRRGGSGKALPPAERDDVAARLAAIDAELDGMAPRFAPAADGARRALARLRASGKSPEEIERSLAGPKRACSGRSMP